ncbi:MAG: NUDIX hydrolase [Burkholderiales bacterium]
MADETPPDYTEHQLTSKLVYDGKLLKVYEDSVRLPDGKIARRELIRHPGAVIIIALLDAHTVIMERQFRYPLGRHFYELPAGKIESGEAPLATAQRELVEECGYTAASWRHLTTLHPCIGYADERFELYLARDLTHVGRELDEGEFLDVIPMTLADVRRDILEGRITDVKVVTGLAMLDYLSA